jgi:hypothetical protein
LTTDLPLSTIYQSFLGEMMRKMTCLAFAVAAMAALPASAAEVGILVDKQIGQSVEIPESGGMKVNSVSPTGFGIRGGVSLVDLKVAELGLTATYHSKAETDLKVDTPVGNLTSGKVGAEYIAIGAQVDWKFLVNLHAGLEVRREKISNDQLSILGEVFADRGSTTLTRPWISAGIGFSIPTPIVSPFFRLEAAWTAKSYSAPSADSTDDDYRRALAPKYQIALYGGIRF